MRVLILEGVSGIRREIDSRLLPEGFAMLRTMVNEFSEAGFEVITTLNQRLKEFAGWLDADVLLDHDGLNRAIKLKPDAALIIAPEKNGELERITAKLGKRGIAVLGAEEEAIWVSGDKWLTYLKLKGKVPQPRTSRTPLEVKGHFLVKPVDGAGCQGIGFFPPSFRASGMIFQEFVKGEHASCCLLMGEREGTVLSVNRQEIAIRDGAFEYFGSEIPLKHKSAAKCAEIALKAAEALNLRGFCGVDLVVGEVPNFIELNPRVTTSFIALAKVLKANLGEILTDVLFNGASMQKPELKGHSLIRIPRVKSDVKINAKKLAELREISGIVAPPFTFDGRLKRGSPIFVAAESGSSARKAKRKLWSAVDKAAALLGVEGNAIAWS